MHACDLDSQLNDGAGHRSGNAREDGLCSQQLNGGSGLKDMVGYFGIYNRHSRDIENHHFRLLFDNLNQYGFHDLMRTLCIYSSDNRQKKDAVVNLDYGCGQFSNCRLMTGHGLKIGRDVRVDGKSHIKEDDLPNRRKGFESFRFISLEMILQSRMDQCEIATVSAKIQLRRHSDPLVRGSDAQAVTYVIEIVGA